MQFEFSTSARIIFGAGKLNSIGDIIAEIGKKAMLVSGCPSEISDRLSSLLETHGITYSFIKVDHEPTIDLIRQLVVHCRRSQSEVVIGIGGGSAMDCAKATAALVPNPGDVSDYLEVIGLNKPLLQPALPIIAIPTTAGTGAEVSRNAVLESPPQHVKVSLRGRNLLPRIALIDPELTLSVPPSITAFTGMDALTQLIEPFTCNSSNPLTDALCREGIQRVGHSLYQAFDHGDDLDARQDMALASLFSGLALANARLGAVHGLAGPIGGEIPVPHGAICARLLPIVMAANINALRDQSDQATLDRYRMIGELLSNDPSASIDIGVSWVSDFCQHARILALSTYGLSEEMFDDILVKAAKSSSMKGNPATLSMAELRNILQQSL